jgi:hypothetical protein
LFNAHREDTNMADTAYTHSSNKFYISVQPANEDLTDHPTQGFPSLDYIEVAAVGSRGEVGLNTNMVNYDTWGSVVVSKGKGLTDAGSADVEMLRVPNDPGQIAMRAAGAPTNHNNYAFKETLQDGTVRYYRGLVGGPRHPGGRNEDFDLNVFTIALNQPPIDVPPPPSP